ncbi:hypothetical protein NL676_003617 [Syzygium grande]|nr:hypothetical protein NL676_003617 [Syzygium grande]
MLLHLSGVTDDEAMLKDSNEEAAMCEVVGGGHVVVAAPMMSMSQCLSLRSHVRRWHHLGRWRLNWTKAVICSEPNNHSKECDHFDGDLISQPPLGRATPACQLPMPGKVLTPCSLLATLRWLRCKEVARCMA